MVGGVFSDFVAARGWGVVVLVVSDFVAAIGCKGVGSGGWSIFKLCGCEGVVAGCVVGGCWNTSCFCSSTGAGEWLLEYFHIWCLRLAARGSGGRSILRFRGCKGLWSGAWSISRLCCWDWLRRGGEWRVEYFSFLWLRGSGEWWLEYFKILWLSLAARGGFGVFSDFVAARGWGGSVFRFRGWDWLRGGLEWWVEYFPDFVAARGCGVVDGAFSNYVEV